VNLPTNQNVLNIYNDRGQIIPSQTNPDNVTFIAENIPSVGYQIFWLETSEIIATHSPLYPQQWILENHFIKVTIDPDNGEIASFWDKTNHQEIFSSGGGNQLRCFQDSGQYWDGWNIDPNYLNHPLPPPKLIDINWGEYGDIQRSIVVRRQFNRSTITQTYHLSQFTNHLDIHTTIDWQEQNTLLKTFFPLNLTAEYITYEIANGAINRPIKNIDRFDQAKWEIPALRWANITDKSINYGVSILNNSKYGYGVNFTDITDHTTTLSLTLLRSPTWPDPNSDRHIHHFTYTIYPHIGTWQNSQTVKKGYELNSPLQIQPINQQNSQGSPNLPISQSFLNLGIENLILTTLKPSESGKNIIIRCYECHGYSSTLNIVNQLNLKPTEIVNILEESIIDREITESIVVRSWEIITLTCS
jgi:alpha-mannosidase